MNPLPLGRSLKAHSFHSFMVHGCVLHLHLHLDWCPKLFSPFHSMTHLLFHALPITHTYSSSTFSKFSCSFKPQKIKHPISSTRPKTIPATDRVIDFGRHKGKMLGTLPSSYLKWVTKNLRTQEFEEWAKLADQVLQDPVYRDRIEWEFAENLLTGDRNMVTTESSVSRLLELSERFGWDNEDKVGWSRVNFEMLGTSKGGRIPRILDEKGEGELMKVEKGDKDGGLSPESEDRRRERRMRVKEKMGKVRSGGDGDGDGDGDGVGRLRMEKSDQDLNVEIHNPFPGREALLKKVMRGKRFL